MSLFNTPPNTPANSSFDSFSFIVLSILQRIYSDTKYSYIDLCTNSILFAVSSNKCFIGNSKTLTSFFLNSNLISLHSCFSNPNLCFSSILNAVSFRNSKYFVIFSGFLKICSPEPYWVSPSQNLSNIPPFFPKIRLYNSGFVEFSLISISDIIAIYKITGIPKTSKFDLMISFLSKTFPVIFS